MYNGYVICFDTALDWFSKNTNKFYFKLYKRSVKSLNFNLKYF